MEPSVKLQIRNLHFPFDATRIPRHWHAGRPAVSAFFDSQSLFFPAGERFFVDAVKAAIPKLKDPALVREARLFCGQEGIHQREHENYNRMLEERGYPAAKLERWVYRLLAFVAFTTLPRWRLGVTCALEHFTAIGAQRALSNPRTFAGAHPLLGAFWRWHAAEETEHKAVPFDIYQAVGGFYLERVMIMFTTTIIFRAYAFFHLCCFLWTDGLLFSGRVWRELFAYFKGEGAAFFRDYLRYYQPGFHPSQIDSSESLSSIRREFATSPLYAEAAAR